MRAGLAGRFADAGLAGAFARADSVRPLALDLSTAQTSACRLLLEGKSRAEVAHHLGVAPSTVADHTRKLYKSLQVRSVQERTMRVRPS
ncbi:LuxR C-terminal-related transcriptional regulator [Roseateles sp.]|uniref:LuxR C-terminal-related transcriptional regulator n=1 Tax=Roseateles sp. TaxID=1971397 RepID=UPI0039E00637